jgi:hypothetical protein
MLHQHGRAELSAEQVGGMLHHLEGQSKRESVCCINTRNWVGRRVIASPWKGRAEQECVTSMMPDRPCEYVLINRADPRNWIGELFTFVYISKIYLCLRLRQMALASENE